MSKGVVGSGAGLGVSRRLETVKPSSTVAVTARAKALKAQGVDVLSFAAGEPDFDTPSAIKRAAEEALRAGQTKYVATIGDPATREVIARKLERENGIRGLTAEHVAISTGGKQSLYLAFQALLNPGDEVLLAVPAWVSYAPMAELAGGRVVEIPTTPEGDFKMTAEQLRSAITARSRVLVLNSPSNPCGTMYTEAELRDIAGVVAEAAAGVAPGLVVVSDEIYEKIVYGGIPAFSIGSVAEIAERVVTVNGLSKAYAMTGWRVGYAACPGEFGRRLMKAYDTLQGQMTTNITSFVYPAIRVALTECAADVERMRAAFAARAELIYGRVRRLEGVRCPRPTGAFYVFPDVSCWFGRTSPGGKALRTPADVAAALLEEAKIAVVPGEDFGGWGQKCVRLSFACSEAQIEAGMDRLEAWAAGVR